jgi:hypothetical protein
VATARSCFSNAEIAHAATRTGSERLSVGIEEAPEQVLRQPADLSISWLSATVIERPVAIVTTCPALLATADHSIGSQ